MTLMQELEIFKGWGASPDYFAQYVKLGSITTDQYKAITGEDYTAPATTTAQTTTPA